MINLIITIFGVVLLIVGFYLMSFGFSNPPDFLLFFLGLCAAVLGLILLVVFGGSAQLPGRESPATSKKRSQGDNKFKPRPQPTKVERPYQEGEEKKKAALDNIEKTIKSGPSEPVKPQPRIVRPKKADRPVIGKKSAEQEAEAAETSTLPPEFASKSAKTKTQKDTGSTPEPQKESAQKEPIKRTAVNKLKDEQPEKGDEFVKKRLDRLKESYIENAKDIESIIDERLDSFKGTLGKLKSESKEPGIIWSFDAGDVQEAMMETISKAKSKILMMYPWIRNIDVSILKKFMETKSCIIIQEASLDDDASVELLRLLLDKDVKIRTMPHVHTIAIVSDDNNGLIISTDPIYESYEVGVVYKDQKSIEEIERLFSDAWSISQDIDLR